MNKPDKKCLIKLFRWPKDSHKTSLVRNYMILVLWYLLREEQTACWHGRSSAEVSALINQGVLNYLGEAQRASWLGVPTASWFSWVEWEACRGFSEGGRQESSMAEEMLC